MKFLDQAKIFVKSGDGGGGAVSFRREKYIEFGGPDGGDGGKGGDIIFKSVANLNTLIDFRYQQHIKAGRGNHGMGKNRTGANGKNILIRVPIGTQIFDENKEVLLADLAEEGDKVVLLKGGDGGYGNTRFKSSTNQSPRIAGEGHEGQECWLWLRLKLIADVGLVGIPNAGKSTLLSRVSRAQPKIGAYPFTTLHPHLGVVSRAYDELIIADLPGLIAGASEGVGLGTRFLGHVERCSLLLHLIDATSQDVVKHYKTVRNELSAYGADLVEKEEMVVLNKCDALKESEIKAKQDALQTLLGVEIYAISGVSGFGVEALIDKTFLMLRGRRIKIKEKVKMGGGLSNGHR